MNCFYCEGPHRIGDCEEVRVHLDLGLLKKVKSRLRLADGSRLPREVGKTTKDLVEAMKTTQPGVILMSKIDKLSLYPKSGVTFYMHTQYEELEERMMQELIQKLGTDKVRQCLQAREEYIAEAEEWEQNFNYSGLQNCPNVCIFIKDLIIVTQ